MLVRNRDARPTRPQGNMSVSDLQIYAAETNAALNKPVTVTANGGGSNLEALSGADRVGCTPDHC